jgi:SAM-dependent methyltransferase
MYTTHWNEFYRKTYLEGKSKALWDVGPERSVGRDYALFGPFMDHSLPMLDLGCGTGAPSAWLAAHFNRVIGVDAAQSAVDLAQQTFPLDNLDFRCVDMADPKACDVLRQEHGDLHLYMRGVLHQIREEDKPTFIRNLRTLMGKRGVLYFIEVAADIRRYFEEASPEFHKLPAAVQSVFISNLPPEGVSTDDVPRLFPSEHFEVLDHGQAGLYTNLSLPDGTQITIPAVYAIIRPSEGMEKL